MSLIRTVFLGTPEIARHCLQSLIDDSHFKVVGVITQPDRPSGRNMKMQASPVKLLAENNGIEVLTPEKISGNTEVLNKVSQWKAECAVVVAFGQILPQNFLDLFPDRVVNIHTSLLPKWRGAAPIQRSIMAGDTKTGVSLQVMVYKLDAGDILGERQIKIDDDMTANQLHDQMMVQASELLAIELMDYLRGNLVGKKQDESLVTYAKKIDKKESEINWNLSASQIYNNFRGLTLGPGVYSVFNGKKIKIKECRKVQLNSKCSPGEIVSVKSDSIIVACGDNGIEIFKLQPESRSQMPVSDFLKGHPLTPGQKFL